MCSFRCYEDLPTCGEGGIRTHGDDKRHNGFRDRPNRPLWHLSERLYYTPSNFLCNGLRFVVIP